MPLASRNDVTVRYDEALKCWSVQVGMKRHPILGPHLFTSEAYAREMAFRFARIFDDFGTVTIFDRGGWNVEVHPINADTEAAA